MTQRKDMIDTRFGFGVLLRGVEVKKFDGIEYPVVNGKELRLVVIESLIRKRDPLTNEQSRYLEKWLKSSYQRHKKAYIDERLRIVAEEETKVFEKASKQLDIEREYWKEIKEINNIVVEPFIAELI
jgi:hypothetical protein